jgi:hypothetical protein
MPTPTHGAELSFSDGSRPSSAHGALLLRPRIERNARNQPYLSYLLSKEVFIPATGFIGLLLYLCPVLPQEARQTPHHRGKSVF